MRLLHWWHSWRAEDVELIAAWPFDNYLFTASLRCKECGVSRARTYLYPILILRLTWMGLRDTSYQARATELSEQVASNCQATNL